MTGNLIIENVTKTYGAHCALKNISLEIPVGKLTSFLGPSGCGKTTLLRMIAGFDTPTSGKIWLDGRDFTKLRPQERGLGVVFQSLALFPHMTVAENVEYGLKRRGVNATDRTSRVNELLSMIHLSGFENRSVTALSGGQRQRVAIARALAVKPSLLLLDEPMSALDARLRDQLQLDLRELQQRLNVTTLFVTHDQSEAMVLSDRIAVFSAGELQQFGGPSQVYGQPANEFVADFLGAANIVEGTVVSGGIVDAFGINLALNANAPAGTKVKLALRGEDFGFEPREGDLAIPGQISFKRDLGSHSELIVKCAEESLRVKSHGHYRDLEPGATVTLHVPPASVSVFQN